MFTIASQAQQHRNAPEKGPMRVVKVDSIIVKKGTAPAKKSTSNTANSNACIYAPNIQEKNTNLGYKHVPLGGEKSYFGPMNEYVNSFVHQYLQVHNKTLNYVQGRGNTQFSVLDNILSEHNLPKELKYLAVIESALNNNAVSHAGAVGPWQLMGTTAKLMGLKVSRKHDDRKDWNKSTNAAAKYLEQLYGQLNDWLLVIAAYNSGPTPVQRAIDRTGSRNFWDIKQYLPRETQGHVLAFIATATIFENLSSFIGLDDIPEDLSAPKPELKSNIPLAIAAPCEPTAAEKKEKLTPPKPKFTDEELKNMVIVRIVEPLSLDFVANELKIDKKVLTRWNPDYDLFVYNTYPTEYYSLRIPKDKLENFLQKREFLSKRSKQIFSETNM
ncbi:MAG: lytic transglycosylase domain-containing protein [Bacteroidota bacterium]